MELSQNSYDLWLIYRGVMPFLLYINTNGNLHYMEANPMRFYDNPLVNTMLTDKVSD